MKTRTPVTDNMNKAYKCVKGRDGKMYKQLENGEMEPMEDKDEDEGEESEKSLDLTDADLNKSLDALQGLAVAGDLPTRKDQLLSKAQSGDLDEDERDELYELMGGQPAREPSMSEQITKGLQEDESLRKAVDVSDYLQGHHTELIKSLSLLGDELEKSNRRQHEYNMVLAKAVTDIGRHVQAVSSRMTAIESQPARLPKSPQGRSRVIEKSFGGQPPAGEALQKGEILQALDDMMEKSMADGSGGRSASGCDIVHETAKFEQVGKVSAPMLNDIKAFRAAR